jgi:hypothetical protein
MAKPQSGNQKGAQDHAEGQHGEKTLSRIQDIANDEGQQRETRSQRAENDPGRTEDGEAEQHEKMLDEGGDGRHRLFEGRKQHDEADKNSEKNRQKKDADRHGHERPEPPGKGGSRQSKSNK